jgi:hypothetical protein
MRAPRHQPRHHRQRSRHVLAVPRRQDKGRGESRTSETTPRTTTTRETPRTAMSAPTTVDSGRLRVTPMDSGSVLFAPMPCVLNTSRRLMMNTSSSGQRCESRLVSCSELFDSLDLSLVPDPILANPSGTHPSGTRLVWALTLVGHSPPSHARPDSQLSCFCKPFCKAIPHTPQGYHRGPGHSHAHKVLWVAFRVMHKQTGFGAPGGRSGAAQGHEHHRRDHLRPPRIPPPQNGLQAESRCND